MGHMPEKVIETFDVVAGFSVLGNDTTNLAVTDNRVRGLKALEFDKVNGAANTKLAGASKTIATKLDQFPPYYSISWYCFVSSLTNVDYTFVRIGTDASNYVEYRFPDTSMTAGVFSFCNVKLATFSATQGTGCDFTDIDYLAVGVAFDAETDTLADIAIDRLSVIPSRRVIAEPTNSFLWVDFIDRAQTLEHAPGRTFYDTGALTLATMSGISGVVNQIGQEDHELVYNETGAQIDNGRAVYRNGVANVVFPDGVTRAVPTIALAQADALSTSVSVAGLATADIADDALGLVTQRGIVRDFDTTSLGFVGPIYLSPTTPGGLTSTQPSPPNRRVLMGGLLDQDVDTGVVLINISFQLEPHLISKDYGFTSRGIAAGTYHRGGFYEAPVGDGNLSEAGATLTFGDANRANSAHAFMVAGAAGAVASGQVGLRVNGISISDLGVRNASDSEELTDDITSLSTDDYIETSTKWLGQPTWELFVVSGAPLTYSLDFNYGFAAYESVGNRDFCISDIEVVGLAGATDASFNIELLHHKATGWTYDAAAFVPGNGAIAEWSADMTPDDNLVNGKPFKWKHVDLFESIQAATGKEGVLLRITTGQNNSVQSMDMHLGTLVNIQ